MSTRNGFRVLVLTLAVVAAQALAAEWPQWRGPTRDGIVPAGPPLAEAWGPAGPRKLWQSEPALGGPVGGMGSVSVANGKAYVFVNDSVKQPGSAAKAGRDMVLCLDAATGATLWKVEFPGWIDGYAQSTTITVDRGRLYFPGSNRIVYCLDATSGKTVWSALMEEQPNRVSSSVLIVDDLAILAGGQLTAYQADSGEEVWRQPKVATWDCSPMLWAKDGHKFLLCNTGHEVSGPATVFCVDPAGGEVLWSVKGGSYSTVVLSGDTMVVQTGSAMIGYRLSPEKADKLWAAPVSDRAASPVICGGHVYGFGGGRVSCVELASGKLAWQEKLPTEISSPIAVNGKIIYVTSQGQSLVMVKATPERFTLLATAKLNLAMCSSAAYADGKLYLRMTDRVACFDLTATGNPQSQPAPTPAAK